MRAVDDLRWRFAPVPASAPGFDPVADAQALIAPGWESPADGPIPGMMTEERLPTGSRMVLRIPSTWNGRLIVAGTPAMRSAYANDAIWSDFALKFGYAYATSDKTIPYGVVIEPVMNAAAPGSLYPIPFDLGGLASAGLGVRFGMLTPTPHPIAAWNADFAAVARMARRTVERVRGKRVEFVYAVGLSNGGAQVRSLLEEQPDLVDGGLEWSAPMWTPERSLLDQLPAFLKAMPDYIRSGFRDPDATEAILAAGFPADRQQGNPQHRSLWLDYYSGQPSFYNDITLFAYALLIDPYARAQAGLVTPDPRDPQRLPGRCAGNGLAMPEDRADYLPSDAAREAIGAFTHTGDIGKPLVGIAGDADMLIPPSLHFDGYAARVAEHGWSGKYRQYLVEGGTHVDTFVPFGYGLQAQLPFAWAAFNVLVDIVEFGAPDADGKQRVVREPDQIVA